MTEALVITVIIPWRHFHKPVTRQRESNSGGPPIQYCQAQTALMSLQKIQNELGDVLRVKFERIEEIAPYN